jgi:hypothetical protein
VYLKFIISEAAACYVTPRNHILALDFFYVLPSIFFRYMMFAVSRQSGSVSVDLWGSLLSMLMQVFNMKPLTRRCLHYIVASFPSFFFSSFLLARFMSSLPLSNHLNPVSYHFLCVFTSSRQTVKVTPNKYHSHVSRWYFKSFQYGKQKVKRFRSSIMSDYTLEDRG